MVKHCAWGTCNSDSRYPERLINSNGISVKFYHFPSFKHEKTRREAWTRACCRADNFVCTKHSYICGFHFVGGNGPTDENPDPIPATASHENCNPIPISSATAERSFSALKRVKTRIRSTMLPGRLEALLLMAVERQILYSLDKQCIINMFAKTSMELTKALF